MSITTHDAHHVAHNVATADTVGSTDHSIRGFLSAVWRHIIEARENQARRILVASLTDSQLRDLGIDRNEAPTRRYLDPHAV